MSNSECSGLKIYIANAVVDKLPTLDEDLFVLIFIYIQVKKHK